MFYGLEKLTLIPLFDTQNVTNMRSMFRGATSLTTVPLLDTQNVTDMTGMYSQATSLTSIPLLYSLSCYFPFKGLLDFK